MVWWARGGRRASQACWSGRGCCGRLVVGVCRVPSADFLGLRFEPFFVALHFVNSTLGDRSPAFWLLFSAHAAGAVQQAAAAARGFVRVEGLAVGLCLFFSSCALAWALLATFAASVVRRRASDPVLSWVTSVAARFVLTDV